jgi:glutamate synthase (ferredoxin)
MVSAINPYLVNEIIRDQVDKGIITDLKADYAIANYNKAIARDSENHEYNGISTLQSYRAARFLKY